MLEELYFDNSFNQLIGNNNNNNNNNNNILNKLDKLKILKFGNNFINDNSKLLANYLPNNLEVLILDSINYNFDLTDIILKYKNSLKILKLESGYTNKLSCLPNYLEKLIVRDRYNHDLLNLLYCKNKAKEI